jgi:hypothetical protein
VRVSQRRCALYGLLIYRQGDRAGSFFSYGFYRNEVVLLPKAQEPARNDIHELQLHIIIDVEVLHLTDVAKPGVQDIFLAEFVVGGLGCWWCSSPVRFMGFSFPLGGEKKSHPSPRYYIQRGQEPSGRKDGRFTARSGAEGGTHRPCTYCSNSAEEAQEKGGTPQVCDAVARYGVGRGAVSVLPDGLAFFDDQSNRQSVATRAVAATSLRWGCSLKRGAARAFSVRTFRFSVVLFP